MSYEFDPKMIYRQPSHFGPQAGPRQGPDGDRHRFDEANKEWPKQTDWIVNFLSNEDQLAALCPPGFMPVGEPVVTISLTDMRGIPWLAGRGYKMLGAFFNAMYKGEKDTAMGPFLTVLWENLADPICSGREEIGFSKMFCDLPDPWQFEGTTRWCASWEGFTFCNMELSDMKPIPVEEPAMPDVPEGTQLGLLHYRYMPKVGEWGKAEASHAVLTPAANPNDKVTEMYVGKGSVKFHKARWEDMPTQYHIVSGLAELEQKEFRGAMIRHHAGSKSLADQKILR